MKRRFYLATSPHPHHPINMQCVLLFATLNHMRFEALLVIGRFGYDGVEGIDCVMAVRIPSLSFSLPPPIVKVVGLMHAVFVFD